jgi:hypothetical protein
MIRAFSHRVHKILLIQTLKTKHTRSIGFDKKLKTLIKRND